MSWLSERGSVLARSQKDANIVIIRIGSHNIQIGSFTFAEPSRLGSRVEEVEVLQAVRANTDVSAKK